MGAGASIKFQEALNNASADELDAAIAGLSPDLMKKLEAALVVAPPTADVQLDAKTAIVAKPAATELVATNPGKLSDFYDLTKKAIGEGSFARVVKATNKSTGVVVAVKRINTAYVTNSKRLMDEIQIQASMDHPNIGKLYDSFTDARTLYLVLELMTGNELFDHIIESGRFSMKQAAHVMKQAFQAELYMNEHGICHRDLKPENFMFLDKSPIETSCLKLIDFGLACKCTVDQVLTTKVGTPYYVAPQVLDGEYDMAADMWSLGVILYVLLCGYPPFFADSDAETLTKVRLGWYAFNEADWKDVSEVCKDLVRKCLEFNPKDRIKPEQALKHQWFSTMEGSESVLVDTQFLDRFRQFCCATKFQKLVCQAIAMQADYSHIKKLKESFLALDTDGNGTLTLDELKQAIEKTGIEDMPSDLIGLMDSIGTKGTKKLNYTEFLAATLDKKVYQSEDQLWCAFCMFDKNGDGKVDVEEIKKVLGESGNELSKEASTAAQEMISEADKNGDSEIDFGEFVAMMRSNAESSTSE